MAQEWIDAKSAVDAVRAAQDWRVDIDTAGVWLFEQMRAGTIRHSGDLSSIFDDLNPAPQETAAGAASVGPSRSTSPISTKRWAMPRPKSIPAAGHRYPNGKTS